MSKIIKDDTGFVPKTILPDQSERPPVWSNLAKPLEADQAHNRSSARSMSSPDEHQFDSDFSAPETSENTLADNRNAAGSEMQTPTDAIDLEPIKEEYFQKGLIAGIERSESDYGSSVRALQSIFEQLDSIRETILSNSMSEMQNLVMQIAEKIIRKSVSEQEETILVTVEEAILQAVKSDEFIISVNPEDYDVIKTRSKDFISSLSGLDNIIVKAEPNIAQGGCLIESDNCTVDASIDSQLEIIEKTIKS